MIKEKSTGQRLDFSCRERIDMREQMHEFRLHGRGGQGIVVAAAIFAEAVFLEGRYARAFSLFGAERRGAPVTAFIRAGEDRLMPRSRIYRPNFVTVFDPTLGSETLLSGLQEGGTMLVNIGDDSLESLPGDALEEGRFRVHVVDATAIARSHGLTVAGFPVVNTVMLGAMAAVSGLASIDNLVVSIKKRITASIEANISAVNEGAEKVKEVGGLVK